MPNEPMRFARRTVIRAISLLIVSGSLHCFGASAQTAAPAGEAVLTIQSYGGYWVRGYPVSNYSASVFSDGTVEYYGGEGHRITGEYNYRIPIEHVNAALNILDEANFDTIKQGNRSLASTSNSGIAQITAFRKGKSHSVLFDASNLDAYLSLRRSLEEQLQIRSLRCPAMRSQSEGRPAIDLCIEEDKWLTDLPKQTGRR
jgi:hypothetical protein